MIRSTDSLNLREKNSAIAHKILPLSEIQQLRDWVSNSQYNAAETFIEKKFKEIETQKLSRSAKDPLCAYLHIQRSSIFQVQKMTDFALAESLKALEHTPQDPLLLYAIGATYFDLKDYSKAGIYWNEALILMHNYAENADEFLTNVVESCEKALSTGVKEHYLYVVLANYYIEFPLVKFQDEVDPTIRYQTVLHWGIEAQKLKPDSEWNDYILGRTYQRLGQHEKAIEHLTKYLKKVPQPRMHVALLRSQLALDIDLSPLEIMKGYYNATFYYDAGVNVAEDLLDKVDPHSDIHDEIKNFQIQLYEYSIELFAKYFDNDTGSSWNNDPHTYAMCLYNLANAVEDDDPEMAHDLCLKALKYSRFAEVELALLNYEAENENYEEVLDMGSEFEARYAPLLSQDVEDDFDQTYRFLNYATAYRNTGKLEEALKAVNMARDAFLALPPDIQSSMEIDLLRWTSILRELLLCHLAAGKIAEADAILEASIKKYPNSAIVILNNYAFDRFEETEDPEHSIKLLTMSIEAMHSDTDSEYQYLAYVNRANILLSNQDIDKALKDYRIAFQIRKNAYLAVQIAICLRDLKQEGKAKFWLYLAQELEKNHDSDEYQEPIETMLEELEDITPEVDSLK